MAMRFDTPVFFQKITPGDYDPDSGSYGQDAIEEDKCWADVTSAGEDTLKMVYGEVRQGSLVIRLQVHYSRPFDRIRIGEGLYKVDFSRKLRNKHVFVASEEKGSLKKGDVEGNG